MASKRILTLKQPNISNNLPILIKLQLFKSSLKVLFVNTDHKIGVTMWPLQVTRTVELDQDLGQLWSDQKPWNIQLRQVVRHLTTLILSAVVICPIVTITTGEIKDFQMCLLLKKLKTSSMSQLKLNPILTLPMKLNPSLPNIYQSSWEPRFPNWSLKTNPSHCQVRSQPHLCHSSVQCLYPAWALPHPPCVTLTLITMTMLRSQDHVHLPLSSLWRTVLPR